MEENLGEPTRDKTESESRKNTDGHALPHTCHTLKFAGHRYTICKETIEFSSGEVISLDSIESDCAKRRRRHQPKLTEVALCYLGHVPVYILRVLKAGTKVTASGRFWS